MARASVPVTDGSASSWYGMPSDSAAATRRSNTTGSLLRYTQDYHKRLSIIRKVLVQEKGMFEGRKVSDRIVSIDRDVYKRQGTVCPLKRAEGITLDQHFFMPESGEADYTFFFEPLPKGYI